MCKLRESKKSGDAEVDIGKQPDFFPFWWVEKVHGGPIVTV
jgi:hypothetical protein